ncbi:serine protease HtrA [Tepidibacter formicigenes]|jgi:S1-C subfamily serine protease|uniref:Serine protease, S1-C subfamily, contains C-terminal PDZ domain n=1 Tax=Tepidibacter formicigenes DSM 15518 TaxID=1123349 RepID=A0A1M6NK20_9FIRM|nr:trypsin-like peptidase domain-containing protein [Tepidibacter formicigenes]SHJ96006.1 serine protease, S1-C subfamily, contains C-terminal PDZ domain [Tepidibacter formicigenes DSM 15518]
MRRGGYFVTAVIGAIIGSLLTLYLAPNFILKDTYNKEEVAKPNSTQIIVNEPKGESVYKAVAKKAMPSVVGITTVTVEKDFFFGARQSSGVGTGVIVDERGYILTNAHVIGDGKANNVSVLFYDGSNQEAKVLWYDTTLDLAIIKVDKKGLPVAALGDSDNVEVGDIAIAIGNPLGLEFERSLTQGIISGLHRSIKVNEYESVEDLIQTDASINPGNSGGPLLNSKGEVIGINTAKIQTAEGLGFAIPINTAKPIVDQFIQKGEFKRVSLGIKAVDVNYFEDRMGQDLGIDEGVYVFQVINNTPAAKAGIKPGDVIFELGGNKIKSMGSLTRELYKFRPKDSTNVKINRGGKEIDLQIIF